MGIRNQQRRAAKKKAREERDRRRAAADGRGALFGVFGAGPLSPPTAEERIDDLLRSAVHEVLHGSPDGLDKRLAELADVDNGLVDRVLANTYRQVVSGLWTRGWMPADVARVIRREHGKRPTRLAVEQIAAELRGYAAATVHDRWHRQLRELDAQVWIEAPADHTLTAWAGRHRLDRLAALQDAVRALAVMVGLPPLKPVAPLPGTVKPGAAGHSDAGSAGSAGGADERLLGRVRALLAKAESTEFPEEAEALSAKAQELMARHSIDTALLAAGPAGRPAGQQPIAVRVGLDAPYERSKALLIQQVAQANHCRSVWSSTLGFATVVGFASDVESVELLHTSLLVQATTAMVRNGPQRGRGGQSTTRSFRQSFLEAYAVRIGQRLRTATDEVGREAAAETGAALLPVLAARDDQVRAATETMFPELVSRAASVNNRAGWVAGTAAADQATLGVRRVVAPD